MLDLALPHDVAPEVGDLPGVTRIDLASLASLPATALVDQFYPDVQAMGGGRWDTSSLLARLERTTENKA